MVPSERVALAELSGCVEISTSKEADASIKPVNRAWSRDAVRFRFCQCAVAGPPNLRNNRKQSEARLPFLSGLHKGNGPSASARAVLEFVPAGPKVRWINRLMGLLFRPLLHPAARAGVVAFLFSRPEPYQHPDYLYHTVLLGPLDVAPDL